MPSAPTIEGTNSSGSTEEEGRRGLEGCMTHSCSKPFRLAGTVLALYFGAVVNTMVKRPSPATPGQAEMSKVKRVARAALVAAAAAGLAVGVAVLNPEFAEELVKLLKS